MVEIGGIIAAYSAYLAKEGRFPPRQNGELSLCEEAGNLSLCEEAGRLSLVEEDGENSCPKI